MEYKNQSNLLRNYGRQACWPGQITAASPCHRKELLFNAIMEPLAVVALGELFQLERESDKRLGSALLVVNGVLAGVLVWIGVTSHAQGQG